MGDRPFSGKVVGACSKAKGWVRQEKKTHVREADGRKKMRELVPGGTLHIISAWGV